MKQSCTLHNRLFTLVLLTLIFTACTNTSKNDLPTTNHVGEYHPLTEDFSPEMRELFEEVYASLDDYGSALVDCRHLHWIPGNFVRASPLAGTRRRPEDCPDSPDDLK